MNIFHPPTIFVLVASASIAASALAGGAQHRDHHAATAASTQVAHADMGKGGGMATMSGHAEQMKAMQAMHDRMMAARTAEERHALMSEHMKVMHDGMGMMGRMGSGAMAGKSGDMASRMGTMEQRMDMMQSMMQMMMDRMAPAPATK